MQIKCYKNIRYYTQEVQISVVIPGLTRNRALRARRSQSILDSRFCGNDRALKGILLINK